MQNPVFREVSVSNSSAFGQGIQEEKSSRLRIPEAHRRLFSFPAALFLLVLMLRLFAIP